MKTYTMLEIAVEVAWQLENLITDEMPRAENRWIVCNIANDIINSGLIKDDSEDIDEIIDTYLMNRGL